jgi:hypothetical protein
VNEGTGDSTEEAHGGDRRNGVGEKQHFGFVDLDPNGLCLLGQVVQIVSRLLDLGAPLVEPLIYRTAGYGPVRQVVWQGNAARPLLSRLLFQLCDSAVRPALSCIR